MGGVVVGKADNNWMASIEVIVLQHFIYWQMEKSTYFLHTLPIRAINKHFIITLNSFASRSKDNGQEGIAAFSYSA